MLSLLLVATDVQEIPLALAHTEMQNALVQAVFQDIDPRVLHTISQCESLEDLCRWPKYNEDLKLFAVICAVTAPTHLTFIGFDNIGTIRYAYLPPDLKNLTISWCEQIYELHTRLLPKSLQELNMSQNKIYGTIDMQNLPQNLETLDVSENLITGPISLQRLPPTLKSASLWSNKIEQRVVPCDPLPPGVTRIDMEFNKIGEVCFSLHEAGDYGGNGRIEEIMRKMKITTAPE